MGLGRKTSTHLSTSSSGASTMSGASFHCFLRASQEGVVTMREWSLKDEAGKHHCTPPPISPASTPVLFQLLAPDSAQASRELASWELYWSTCSSGSPLSALQALTRRLLDSSIPSNHAVLTSGLIICHPQLHPSSLSLRSLAVTQLAASFLLWFLELATQGSAIFSLSQMGRLGDGPEALCSALLRRCCWCCCLASSLHSWILFVLLIGVIFVLLLNQNVARSEVILSCLKWVKYWSTGLRSFHVWMDYDQHPKASTIATRTGTLLGLVLRNYSIK